MFGLRPSYAPLQSRSNKALALTRSNRYKASSYLPWIIRFLLFGGWIFVVVFVSISFRTLNQKGEKARWLKSHSVDPYLISGGGTFPLPLGNGSMPIMNGTNSTTTTTTNETFSMTTGQFTTIVFNSDSFTPTATRTYPMFSSVSLPPTSSMTSMNASGMTTPASQTMPLFSSSIMNTSSASMTMPIANATSSMPSASMTMPLANATSSISSASMTMPLATSDSSVPSTTLTNQFNVTATETLTNQYNLTSTFVVTATTSSSTSTSITTTATPDMLQVYLQMLLGNDAARLSLVDGRNLTSLNMTQCGGTLLNGVIVPDDEIGSYDYPPYDNSTDTVSDGTDAMNGMENDTDTTTTLSKRMLNPYLNSFDMMNAPILDTSNITAPNSTCWSMLASDSLFSVNATYPISTTSDAYNLPASPVPGAPINDSIFSNPTTFEAFYPEGSFTPSGSDDRGGFGWYGLPFNSSSANRILFGYQVYFPDDWQPNMGGKLPGIVGGTNISTALHCSGGADPDNQMCFSNRFMWRTDNMGESYLYVPNMQAAEYCDVPPRTVCNPDFGDSMARGAFNFTPGTWNTIAMDMQLNTPNKTDGIIRTYFNGVKALEYKKLNWRTDESVGFQMLLIETFFGGGSSDWASPVNQTAQFTNFGLFQLQEEALEAGAGNDPTVEIQPNGV